MRLARDEGHHKAVAKYSPMDSSYGSVSAFVIGPERGERGGNPASGKKAHERARTALIAVLDSVGPSAESGARGSQAGLRLGGARPGAWDRKPDRRSRWRRGIPGREAT